MKSSKAIFIPSILLFASSFFIPSYLISIFGENTSLFGWQCFLYNLTGVFDAFDSSAGFNSELFFSSLFAIFTNLCLIFGVVAFLRNTKRRNLLLIIGSSGFLAALWWLGHEFLVGELSNLLIGYYLWVASYAGIMYAAIKRTGFSRMKVSQNSSKETDKNNSKVITHFNQPIVPVQVRIH